jgi:hypothetical protein
MGRKRNKLINKQAYKKVHKFCFFCGEDDYSSLQCHRITPGEDGGTYHEANTLTICASCHCKVHSGRIKIDRKYTQSKPGYKVHYWFDGEEFWRDEELGFVDNQQFHENLGKSAKAFLKK